MEQTTILDVEWNPISLHLWKHSDIKKHVDFLLSGILFRMHGPTLSGLVLCLVRYTYIHASTWYFKKSESVQPQTMLQNLELEETKYWMQKTLAEVKRHKEMSWRKYNLEEKSTIGKIHMGERHTGQLMYSETSCVLLPLPGTHFPLEVWIAHPSIFQVFTQSPPSVGPLLATLYKRSSLALP